MRSRSRNFAAVGAPIFEPGLDDLLQSGCAARRLDFTTDPSAALFGAEVLWVAYDTPVDETDRADAAFVVDRVAQLFPHLRSDTLVLISSQMPVGSTARLEQMHARSHPGVAVSFGYSPENLRLGKAIDVFMRPDRVVVGVRSDADRRRVTALLGPITEKILWMSVESAEMTKHAVNAFLAASVAFINEIAALCEHVGADAKEVERGLKSEQRIGPKAYLSPGAAFAGGTLARDIAFLSEAGAKHGEPLYLLNAVRASNDAHKQWLQKKLQRAGGPLERPDRRGLGADLQARHRHASPIQRRGVVPLAVAGRSPRPGSRSCGAGDSGGVGDRPVLDPSRCAWRAPRRWWWRRSGRITARWERKSSFRE